MRNLYISGETGKYRLVLREWYFQGDHPDYTTIKELSNQEAYTLTLGGISHLFGDKIEKPRIRKKYNKN